MTTAAANLADWATSLDPSADDLALARRSLLDTVAVAYAAREHPLRQVFDELSRVGRWTALAHVLDFDDLHMPSTTHISAVCVPVALATKGGARAYLAGAGVMARLGTALGWRHYTAGWHATCTVGAPAAAVAASVARGLDADRTATAIALAVPAAGGVQRAFGTAAKSLQVAFAAEAGIRAAALAAAGATADPLALDEWMALVGGGGDPAALTGERLREGPAVPGGLAIKFFPCCYALQRPISAIVDLEKAIAAPDDVQRVTVSTPASSLKPLIHKAPTSGLEGKFSLEYGIAAALLDGRPDLESFEDHAVNRPEARRLMQTVETVTTTEGENLLDGDVQIELRLNGSEARRTTLTLPPGAPDRPPTETELRRKLEACALAEADQIAGLSWENAAAFVAAQLP